MLMATNQSGRLDKEPDRPGPENPDSLLVKQLEKAILKRAGGIEKFRKKVPLLLRKAIDEVIDSPRTKRFTLDETKINERIYLGTKIRVQLRSCLKLERENVLDPCIGGTAVEIQSTISQNWSVPPEFVGKLCLLVKSDEKRAVCSVGTMMIRDELLNEPGKSSRRRTISKAGIENIRWVLKDEPFPPKSSHLSAVCKKDPHASA
jgi:hypothetical protein